MFTERTMTHMHTHYQIITSLVNVINGILKMLLTTGGHRQGLLHSSQDMHVIHHLCSSDRTKLEKIQELDLSGIC